MNIQNQVSKESLGVKFKDDMQYAPNCFENSGLTVTCISVILLGQDGFESECPEIKFQTIIS